MKKILAVLGIMAVAGCHQDHHGGSIYDPWYITYSNGHPIAAEAESTWVLDQEDEMIDLINMDRAMMGLNVLIRSPLISDVARAHSIHMAAGNFEGSYNPEGDGPADRAAIAGFYFNRYGQNVSAGFSDSVDVFNNWMMISSSASSTASSKISRLMPFGDSSPSPQFRVPWVVIE